MFELIKADMSGKASANYDIIEKLRDMCNEFLKNNTH